MGNVVDSESGLADFGRLTKTSGGFVCRIGIKLSVVLHQPPSKKGEIQYFIVICNVYCWIGDGYKNIAAPLNFIEERRARYIW